MRIAMTAIAAATLLSACGGVQYKDTNPAVNANPQCAANPKPGELVAPWCEREQSASWTLGGESKPVDFSGKDE